jgi:hypothetical protein
MMNAPVARVVEYTGDRPGRQVWTWCPGCDSMHPFTIEAPPGPDGDRLNSGTTWQWDGNLERPTFSPSLLCHSSIHLCEGEHDPTPCPDYESCEARGHAIGYVVDGVLRFRFPEGPPEGLDPVYCCGSQPHTKDPAWGNCHSFLRAGRWEFLSDSAHHLAGQTVDMVPLPDWYAKET